MKKKLLCCLVLFLFAGAYTAAQETDLQNSPDEPQNAAVEDVQTQQKQDPKKKAEPKAEPPKQKTENSIQTLLPVKEGNFKYSRIPGITLPQTAPMGDILHVPEEQKKEIVRATEDEEQPFFFKINADLIKVLLLFLILAIFIFYRVNSKKRRRKYFKH